MGMFDYNTGYSEGLTPGQRARRRADQSEQQLVDRQISPFVEKHTGYVSPKVQLQRMASQTDLSDGRAVQKTYNAILAKNPTAAQKWLESIKPIITQHIEQQKLAATLRGKQGERKIIKDAQGRQRYVDDKSLVFPGVADKQDKTPAPVKHINKFVAAGIKAEIDDVFGGSWSNWFGTALPGSMTEESLIDFIHRYTELNPGETTHSVMNKIVEFQTSKGTTGLDATKPITASTPGGQTTPPSSSNPFNVPAQPK